MGVDFAAIIDHRLKGAELYALPDRLNARWELSPKLAPWVAEHVVAGPRRWTWKCAITLTAFEAELSRDSHVSLDGPDGFHGYVAEHAIMLVHLARWWTFLCEPDGQDGLQAACRLLASSVEAENVLYLPDSALHPAGASDVLLQGGTVADALRWLHAEVDAPMLEPGVFRGWHCGWPDESAWFHECRADDGTWRRSELSRWYEPPQPERSSVGPVQSESGELWYPCPCCGYVVFREPPNSYALCPICSWQDDVLQLRFPTLACGANHVTLVEAQGHFQECGASRPYLTAFVRAGTSTDRRDSGWRPIDESRDEFEHYSEAAARRRDDTFYYWRSKRGNG